MGGFRFAVQVFALGALAATAGPAAHADDQSEHATMIDERFSLPIEGGARIEASVSDADIDIVEGADGEARVEVVLSARSIGDRARTYFERQQFEVRQVGDTIQIATDPLPTRELFSGGGWKDWRITVRVTAPEAIDAELRTSDGDVTLARIGGDVSVATSDGDVTVGAIVGGDISLRTSDGDVAAERLEAEAVRIRTSDGDVELGEVEAGRVMARTSDGDILAEAVVGDVELETSDGDIEIARVAGPSFAAQSSDGSITVADLGAETSRMRAGDGDIELERVSGNLEAVGSDSDIAITLAPGLGADLDLRAESVWVAGGLEIAGDIRDDRIDGAVNGGGARIRALTADGDVVVRGL